MPTEGGEFRKIVDDDVRVVGMMLDVVLMIIFGRIKSREWCDLRDDFLRVDFGGRQLRDVGFSDLFLFGSGVEKRGAIL